MRDARLNESLKNSACTGKARHETFAAASKQLQKSKQGKNAVFDKRHKLGIYLCGFCNGYHIGNKVKKGYRV